MKLSNIIKKLIIDFFIIFGGVIIILSLIRQLLAPELTYDLKSIYIIMIFSLAGDLPSLILYSSKRIGEKNMRIRIILHFFIMEAVILGFAVISGLTLDIADISTLAVIVAVIYFLLRFLTWQNDKRDTDEINVKLKKFRMQFEDKSKNE